MTVRIKVRLLLISILSVLLIGAKGSDLMRLTILNKSGQDIGVRLITPDNSRFYYLRVPAGDKKMPTESIFTIDKDVYRMRVIYYLAQDPNTGYECVRSRSATLMALRNIRVTVTPCFAPPPTCGEPSMWKMGCVRCIR